MNIFIAVVFNLLILEVHSGVVLNGLSDILGNVRSDLRKLGNVLDPTAVQKRPFHREHESLSTARDRGNNYNLNNKNIPSDNGRQLYTTPTPQKKTSAGIVS